ncbi:hypothetical protein [Natrinema ejinorense]|nr:hypothetical protein [Natrinema ejinorense]
MTDKFEERINHLEERAGPSIESDDLPDGHVDPGSYYTNDDGDWNHERQMEHLLSTRGPAKVATHALDELNTIEYNIEALETNFLKLYQWAVEGEEITSEEKAHLESIAREIRTGHGYVDDTEPQMADAVRTALVVLGELTDVEHDRPDE